MHRRWRVWKKEAGRESQNSPELPLNEAWCGRGERKAEEAEGSIPQSRVCLTPRGTADVIVSLDELH